jgi:hypothetical protein
MSDHDDYDEFDDEPEADDQPATKRRLMERLMDAAPAAPAKATLDRNGNPTKWSIDRLDGRERVYSYIAAFMAAFFALFTYFAEADNANFHIKKGQFTPQTTLIVGVVCAIALFATAYLGRRALVGFVALFTFLGFSNTDFVIGLPFLLLAAWLLYRSYKVQKEVTARIKSERAAGPSESPSARPSRTEAAADRRAGTRAGGRKKGPGGPEANKRYTPKKPVRPPPPPPKPSWRERRAEKASD